MTENSTEITTCHRCGDVVIGDNIVRYRLDGHWQKWCWPCFKREHLTNLTRLQEGNK